MALVSLRVEHFRCIEAADLELDRSRNFVFGPNGAGKTSLLEAVHVLGRGRSFRAGQNASLVAHGAGGFDVAGRVAAVGGRERQLGVRFDAGALEVRIDRERGRRSSELAALLPVHVVEPEMHRLIGDGPSRRRRFLDWGVFHVEPTYLTAWREYRRALAQRNAALKTALQGPAFEAWSEQLVAAALRVERARAAYVDGWRPRALAIAARLTRLEIEMTLDPGGYAERMLADALKRGEARDRRSGVTQVGPHRADLRLRIDAAPLRERASRGQQKLIAAALILGQVEEHVARRPGAGILLVDDPAAELDAESLRRLLRELERLPVQTVVTGITAEPLEPLGAGRVFHVEQGVIRAQRV